MTDGDNKVERYDPAGDIAAVNTKTRDYLGDRSRVVAVGIVALVWGLLVGEAKLVVGLDTFQKWALVTAATGGLLALLLDYFEYLFVYLDTNLFGGGFLGPGGRLMFGAKQVVTVLSTAIVVSIAFSLVVQATNTEAQSGGPVFIWAGQVWDKSTPNERRSSHLYLSTPDPFTGTIKVEANDKVQCSGKRDRQQLIVLCESTKIRLDGVTDGKTYTGQWTTFTHQQGGGFSYQFQKKLFGH